MISLIFAQLYIVAVGALLFAIVKIARAFWQYRFVPAPRILTDAELPTVSVCVPARDETHAMTACLESVLASNYPKLEVIVLDDDSSDDTPNLIRAFAHAGVRFVPGEPLPDDWLGKNFSLETLLEEASGRYVVFMDVDTTIAPGTIRQLVEYMRARELAMISVMPQRYDTYRPSAWLGSLRYFWELVLGSQARPATSSALWAIERRVLRDNLGGFGYWRDEVRPESMVARELAKTDDYAFLRNSPDLGVRYEKKWSSQVETARRLLLPRFYNSVASVIVGAGLVLSVVLSQIIIIVALWQQSWVFVWFEIALSALAAILFAGYYRLAWARRWWLGVLFSPLVAWQELVLLLASAIGYRRGTITWKGRAVGRPTRKRR